MNDFEIFMKNAAAVKPSDRQLAWFDTEFYAFVHFTVNTYTDLEWGRGDEDPAIFNPIKLDCDSWVEAVQSAGMKGLILTAKHHDGFCLWPSGQTEHSIKNSPYLNGKGDIVKEAAEACQRGGIKFGVYLSPWDRNCDLYGTDAYNDFYCAQLEELLTGYGELFMIWFDGACGEGPNGKKQVYDYDRYIKMIRKYQPDACVFNDHGPDVRWCGNESGTARNAEWAVVPHELCFRSEKQTDGALLKGDLSYMYSTNKNIGSLQNIIYSDGLVFTGSEIDMSIRPGWFYHKNEEPHSLERLLKTYFDSVGGNACFNLNIPPTPEGLFDPRDVARLKELGNALQSAFSDPLAVEIDRLNQSESDTQAIYEIKLKDNKHINYVVLAEEIAHGQRVEAFLLETKNELGQWQAFYEGQCIGHKKICQVQIETDMIRLHITSARDTVKLREIQLF